MSLRWIGLCALALSMSFAAHARNEGVRDDEIRIGSSAVLTGALGPQTVLYTEGSKMLFDAVNAKGGVHGRMIRYTVLDDEFKPAKAVENTRKLLEDDKVFLLYNSTGTEHINSVLPLLKEHRTIMLGPVTGASALRDVHNPYLFHVRASYANEAQRIISQLRLQGMNRIAVFYQDDAFGKALLAELNKASASENLPFVSLIKVDPKAPDFEAAALETEKHLPHAVVMATGGTTFPLYVQAVRKTKSRPVFYGFSVASLDAINSHLKDTAHGIVLAQIMPSMRDAMVPVVADYLNLLRASSPNAAPSNSQLEGFVHASLLVEGLRRAGRNLSTDTLIRAFEDSGEITFGKMRVRYGPRNRAGSNYVELAIVDGQGNLRY